eukprot:MONOS_9566.1-p1 / transcript=MONOS_9566.1 / gene=MONOS_9566 / organism=Monocercomonoides_exilis_PA203 / gene_product=Microtubule-associated protein RP/EB family member 1 / transcript_product=Microtubule-associated protein RP/EB family member 1 / location=Mono_scaffold00399:53938-55113(+) / protein_length=262 / sequence_SO=supercontig / SO=protein_coding / is_pseudo=false
MSDKLIGVMEGAFFVSRTELVNWLNDILQLEYTKLDQAANGAAFCQIVDVIYPGKVPLHRVNFDAKLEYEFEKNYKILQDCFTKLNIQKSVDVQRLSKGKFQDVLEFCQWLKRFYDIQLAGGVRTGYDPVARREGKPPSSELIADGMHLSGQMSPRAGSGEVHPRTSPKTAGRAVTAHPKGAAAHSRPSVLAAGSRGAGSHDGHSAVLENEMKQLKEEREEMKETMDGIERERNFYFDKLRQIEILCQTKEDDPLIKQILDV